MTGFQRERGEAAGLLHDACTVTRSYSPASAAAAASTSVVHFVCPSLPPTTRIRGPCAVSSRAAANSARLACITGPGENSIVTVSMSSVVANGVFSESRPPRTRTCCASTAKAAHRHRAERIDGPGANAMVRTSSTSVVIK
mmetsp:Transcript_6116/g.21618  ORF Transcript_6116/g.21618 Transcript_6116/m.21618 type:complete len:141 (-) Transcript_6116:84-506(-)